jgi:chain length determinant protein EpsF
MNFEQFFQILASRKTALISTFVTVVVIVAGICIFTTPQYTAEVALVMNLKTEDPLTGMPNTSSMLLEPTYMATQVEMIESHSTAVRVVDALGLAKNAVAQEAFQKNAEGRGDIRDWLADVILHKLLVKPSKESMIITVSYSAEDPKFAAAMANAFSQAYIKTVIDINSAAAQQNSEFIRQQLRSLQKDLEDAQKRYSDYQQKEGIIASDERIDVETQRLNDISTQLVAAQAQTYDAQSRARTGSSSESPDILNSPVIQQIKVTLSQQEAKFQELAAKVGPNHPQYLQAQAEIEATRQQLVDASKQFSGGLNSSASIAESRVASLRHALDDQRKRVLELKSRRSQLEVLSQDIDSAQKTYDSAQLRFSQTSLASHSDVSNVAILSSASEPMKPSRPKPLLYMAASLVVGLLFGVAVALCLELMDRRIRSTNDIETILDFSVLANLADIKPSKHRPGVKSPKRFRLASRFG